MLVAVLTACGGAASGGDVVTDGTGDAVSDAAVRADAEVAVDTPVEVADLTDAEPDVQPEVDLDAGPDGETALDVEPASDTDAVSETDSTPVSDADASADTDVASMGGEVVLNEVSAGGADRIELVNRGDAAQDISGWRVFDSTHSTAKSYAFSTGTVIAAGAYLVLTKGQQHTFGLGAADGVILERASGASVDSTAWPKGMAEVSWCRFPDRFGAFGPCSVATFGAANLDVDDAVIVAPLWIGGGLSATVAGPDYDTLDELTFDAAGRLWVADAPAGLIHVYDQDATFLETVGGLGAGPGKFLGLESVRLTQDGRIGAMDRSRKAIQFFDVETRAFAGSVPCTGCKDPVGLAFPSSGETLVVEQSPNRVLALDAAGAVVGGYQIGDGSLPILAKPETLALDEATNRLLVTSENAARVEIFDLAERTWRGEHIGDHQASALPEPGRFLGAVEGIAVDHVHGLLFMSDEDNGRILVHALDDTGALYDAQANFAFLGAFGRVGAAPGELSSVDGLAVDAVGGRLAVADEGNNRVQVFSIDSIMVALGLGPDAPPDPCALLPSLDSLGPPANSPSWLGTLVALYDCGVLSRDALRDRVATVPAPSSWPVATTVALTAADAPWSLESSMTVPAGQVLLMAPGARLRLASGVRLTVLGRVLWLGSADAPLTIDGDAPGYDTIALRGGPHVIAHASFSLGSGLLTVGPTTAEVTLEDLRFDAWQENALRLDKTAYTTLARAEFGADTPVELQSGEALYGNLSSILLTESIFWPTTSNDDSLDLENCPPGLPARIVGNVFLGGLDDAIDLDICPALVDGNFIQNYQPPPGPIAVLNGGGVTGQQSAVVLVNNVILGCRHGVGFKDGSHVTLAHTTITGCGIGVSLYKTDPSAKLSSMLAINALVYGNSDTEDGAPHDIELDGAWTGFPGPLDPGLLDARYCIFGQPWPGDGNLVADPLWQLVDGVPRLQPGSPAAKTGVSPAETPLGADTLKALAVDFLGTSRTDADGAWLPVSRGAIEP